MRLLQIFFGLACYLLLANTALADWMQELSPHSNENYARLQKADAYYQSLTTHSWPQLEVPPLQKNDTNHGIPELRERLRLTTDLLPADDNQSEIYDEKLIAAVKHFQWRHGLQADGVIGLKTLHELNVSPFERAEEIRRNMQRWAALPANLGDRFIFINIPDYRFNLIDQGKTVLTMKVIVGKPDRPTPELTSVITQAELNPYWNIPPQIAKKDVIPKIIKDPAYLDQMNIKIVQHRKSGVTIIDPHQIDWQEVARNGFNYELRQEPGKNNSLGLVKFDFANPYDVYIHDTPAKELFNRENRIFSSGCIRLEKPFALLSYLLLGDEEWDIHRVAESLDSGKLTYIKIKPIPIYIVYATSWVDSDGVLHFRHDPYHYNEDPDLEDMASDPMLNEAKVDNTLTMPLSFYA
ncbi:MAG TPA: L,D-transpeptidase family protein [Gammaproteobacteria bacterium]|nr:L,D-transpeptidase family protein [Gammaproteobacteria bacterium]